RPNCSSSRGLSRSAPWPNPPTLPTSLSSLSRTAPVSSQARLCMPMAGSTWPDYLAGVIVLEASGLAKGGSGHRRASSSGNQGARTSRHDTSRHVTGQPRGKRAALRAVGPALHSPTWHRVWRRALRACKQVHLLWWFAGTGEHHAISCLIQREL